MSLEKIIDKWVKEFDKFYIYITNPRNWKNRKPIYKGYREAIKAQHQAHKKFIGIDWGNGKDKTVKTELKGYKSS